MLIVLYQKLDPKNKLRALCSKANFWVLLALALVIYASSFVLNLPVLTMYRFGIYFVSFMIGYLFFSNENIQQLPARYAPWLMSAAIVCGLGYVWLYHGQNFTSDAILQSLPTNLYLWLMVLAILGTYRKYFNTPTPFSIWVDSHKFETSLGFVNFIFAIFHFSYIQKRKMVFFI